MMSSRVLEGVALVAWGLKPSSFSATVLVVVGCLWGVEVGGFALVAVRRPGVEEGCWVAVVVPLLASCGRAERGVGFGKVHQGFRAWNLSVPNPWVWKWNVGGEVRKVRMLLR